MMIKTALRSLINYNLSA